MGAPTPEIAGPCRVRPPHRASNRPHSRCRHQRLVLYFEEWSGQGAFLENPTTCDTLWYDSIFEILHQHVWKHPILDAYQGFIERCVKWISIGSLPTPFQAGPRHWTTTSQVITFRKRKHWVLPRDIRSFTPYNSQLIVTHNFFRNALKPLQNWLPEVLLNLTKSSVN